MRDINPMLEPDDTFTWYSARLPNNILVKVHDEHFWNIIMEVERAFCKREKVSETQQEVIQRHLDQTAYRAAFWLERKAKEKDPRVYIYTKKEAA